MTFRGVCTLIALIIVVASQMAHAQTNNNFTNEGTCNGCANIMNMAPPRLPFSPDIGDQLIAKLTDSKKLTLQTVGNATDQEIGAQYGAYLQQHGYQVNRVAIGMLVPVPDHKITVGKQSDGYVVIIAPSAQ